MPVTGKIRIIDRGEQRILSEIRKLDGRSIKVGVQADAGAEADGTELVVVAAANEFGVPKGPHNPEIPARPAFRTMADTRRGQLYRVAVAAYEGILSGGTAMRCLGVVGNWYQDTQKRVLRDGPWVKNADATIAKKKSATPLIDSTRLVNSIRYIIQVGKR